MAREHGLHGPCLGLVLSKITSQFGVEILQRTGNGFRKTIWEQNDEQLWIDGNQTTLGLVPMLGPSQQTWCCDLMASVHKGWNSQLT